jgi:hypothetical protein
MSQPDNDLEVLVKQFGNDGNGEQPFSEWNRKANASDHFLILAWPDGDGRKAATTSIPKRKASDT